MYVIIGFIAFALIICIMSSVLFIAQWNAGANAKHSLAYLYVLKVSGIVMVLVKHILFQPLVIVLLSTTGCSLKNENGKSVDLGYSCMTDVHLILMACALVALVLLVLLTFLSVVLYADEQPDSHLPWAYCSRVIDAYKLLRKLILSATIYVSSTYSGLQGVEVACYLILTLLSLHELYRQAHMNDRKIFYALLTSEGAIAWISLAALLKIVVNTDWSSPIVLAIFVIILLVVIHLTSQQERENILMSSTIASLKEIEDVETYCRLLLEMAATKGESSKVSLEGIITMHAVSCFKPHCPCRKLCGVGTEEQAEQGGDSDCCGKKEAEPEAELSPGKPGKALPEAIKEKELSKMENAGDAEMGEGSKRQQYLYRLLIDEITVWNSKQEKRARLHIYLAYLKLFCFENQLAALYELMCARESAPNLYEGFLIYRMMYAIPLLTEDRNRIEMQIIKRESLQQSSSEIDNLIMFQQILAEMQEIMQESLKLFIGFWKELQDESPNFQYLGNMSHEITSIAGKIRVSYKHLIAINPTNIYCRMLYALFLKKIMKDEFEAFDIYEEYFCLDYNSLSKYKHDDKQQPTATLICHRRQVRG